jgi:hypothetical protein
MAEAADRARPGLSLRHRLGGWLRERAYQMSREKCPYCRSTPVHSTAEMVLYTNSGYKFPTVALTYCLICEQLLGAHLVDGEPACDCAGHIESDIAESDTLGIKNPHRLTDIVFSSCSVCGRVLDAQIHY